MEPDMDRIAYMREAAKKARANREAAEKARAERLADLVNGAESGEALSVEKAVELLED